MPISGSLPESRGTLFIHKQINECSAVGQNEMIRHVLCADFDFLLQEKSFIKIMEGAYDHWGQGAGQGCQTLDDVFADMDAMVMGGEA